MRNNQNIGFLKNISRVAFSNILTILSGILMGFLIPKIMGITDYGYYKTFTLYFSYVGIFHFGFIDGIYLYYAGKNYENLDKNQFRYFSRFLFKFQLIVSIFILLITLFFINSDYIFIFIFTALGLLINNLTSYYRFVSQITFRFKELSKMNILLTFLNSTIVLLLFIGVFLEKIDFIDYKFYLCIYTIVNLVILLIYIYIYKDITFGKIDYSLIKKELIKSMFIMGFPLLISNLIDILLLNMDKQFVSILFSTNTYAFYAFAYNMLTIITTAVTAISTVLYPSLKTKDKEGLTKIYSPLISIIMIFISFCLLSYFPLVFIVEKFLSEYVTSLSYFKIILPGLMLQTSITIIMVNYYKSLDMVKKYFSISILILFLSFILNLVSYSIWHSAEMISFASIITFICWYIISNQILIKKLNLKENLNFVYAITVILNFYLITNLVNNLFLGFIIYLLSNLIITIIFKYNLIKNISNFIKVEKRNKKFKKYN